MKYAPPPSDNEDMAIFLFLLSIFVFSPASAEMTRSVNIKPLYRLPADERLGEESARRTEKRTERETHRSSARKDKSRDASGKEAQEGKNSAALPPSPSLGEPFLVGTSEGLFRIANDMAIPVGEGQTGKVEQILRLKMPIVRSAGELHDGTGPDAPASGMKWYFRTSRGIISSSDLKTFDQCNAGLTSLVVKKFIEGKATLVNQCAMLKDLAVDPLNNLNMATATENAVFISRDGAQSWQSVGSVSDRTPGIKAVAIATMPSIKAGEAAKVVAFMSHSIFGFAYMCLDDEKPVWREVSSGIKIMESLTSTDEVADIYPMLRTDSEGKQYVEIYLCQSYLPNLYRFDWARKTCVNIYKGSELCDTFDAITSAGDKLLFSRIEGLSTVDVNTLESDDIKADTDKWKAVCAMARGFANCAWIPPSQNSFGTALALGELWLLNSGTLNTPYADKAMGKKCVYVSAYQCREEAGRNKFRKIIKDNNLNALVIDMKDDYGLLRYDTRDPLVMKKGYVTQYKVNLDDFVKDFKADDVYLIARIVVFKDKHLSQYNGGECAVWDAKTNAPWVGVRSYNSEGGATYYDENWVDPYSPLVWEYNVAIAKELVERGFDEIQFDYIRFPTDGLNMKNASYRAKSEGMTKESALISFLSYARENIAAPLGIDIYGANGWYRSGTRTGQDSEMLAEYVDVVGAMFYPSHFENSFMNCAPWADRPYRIYFYGTYRNSVMMRNRAIARPWVQAFKLGVPYDKQFYGPEYIQKEILGVQDAANRGYMYWNNAGDYSKLRPDSGLKAYSKGERRPAIGSSESGGDAPLERQNALVTEPKASAENVQSTARVSSVLDTIVEQDKRREGEAQYSLFGIGNPSVKGL